MTERGRTPKIDGPKAREGARGLIFDVFDGRESLKPPAGLCKHGKRAWRLAVRSLLPAGVLANGDLMLLEAFARAWGRWRMLEDQIAKLNRGAGGLAGELMKTPNGYLQISSLRISADRALKDARIIGGQFGLTPVSRVRTVGAAQGELFAPDELRQPEEPVEDETDRTSGFFKPRLVQASGS